jgi:hypothetical protein
MNSSQHAHAILSRGWRSIGVLPVQNDSVSASICRSLVYPPPLMDPYMAITVVIIRTNDRAGYPRFSIRSQRRRASIIRAASSLLRFRNETLGAFDCRSVCSGKRRKYPCFRRSREFRFPAPPKNFPVRPNREFCWERPESLDFLGRFFRKSAQDARSSLHFSLMAGNSVALAAPPLLVPGRRSHYPKAAPASARRPGPRRSIGGPWGARARPAGCRPPG